jgi:PAS domain S-box-containing protein
MPKKDTGRRKTSSAAPRRKIAAPPDRNSTVIMEALRASEERYRIVVETMLQGVVHQDADGTIIAMNPASEQILGKTQAEFVGSSSVGEEHDTVREDGSLFPGLEHPAMVALRTGEPVRSVLMGVYHPKRRERRWISVDAVPVFRPGSVRPAEVYTVFEDITERRQAEEQLRKNEERLRLAQASASMGVWDWEPATGRAVFTPENERLYGLPPGTVMTYQHFRERVHPDDIARVERERDDAVVRHEPFDLEFRVIWPTGEMRWLAAKGGAVYGPSEEVVRVFGVNLDITDRKRSEEQLRELTQRLSYHVDNSPLAVIEWGADMRLIRWSGEAERIFGWKASEVLGKRMEDFRWVHAADQAQVADVSKGLQTGSDPRFSANRNYRKDGSVVHCEWYNSSLMDESGNLRSILSLVLDVSARREAEEALKNSERLYRAIGESIEYGVWVCAPDGRNIYASDSFLKMVGQTQEECSNFGWGDVLHPDDAERTISAWKECVRTQGTWDIEHRFRGVDGAWHHILARGAPVRNSRGEIINWAGINLDISRMKKTEEALRDREAELRENDRRKNEFMATLSHELRNPLTPIRNSLFILDHAVPGGEQARRAKDVLDRQVGQLTRLVDDLLDVTRISRGKIKIQPERCELGGLVHRTVEDHRTEFAAAGVEFDLHLADKPIWLSADPSRIAQAVGNLLQNAAKFAASGGRTILTVEEDTNAEMAVIRVRDTGIGIAPDVLSLLFQPFMQGPGTLDRGRGGLGLGLALVKGLVELHGGTVEARSDGPGKGAEFILRLPVDREMEAPRPAPPERPSRAGRRVLIIEDNVDVANSLREALGFLKHTVEVAHNGPEGLAKAREFKPEIVLCDIGLPGMDGYDVARAFRADPGLSGLFLVALTGYALPRTRAKRSRPVSTATWPSRRASAICRSF